MTKATLKLKSGAVVIIEGTPGDVHQLLAMHEAAVPNIARHDTGGAPAAAARTPRDRDPVSDIVNVIRSCEDAEQIEANILDRSSAVNRCLLPLYILAEEAHTQPGLSTGQISAVTKELRVFISQANVAHTIAGPAARFVMASSTRKRGVPTEYRINRRGVQHLKEVIKGQNRS